MQIKTVTTVTIDSTIDNNNKEVIGWERNLEIIQTLVREIGRERERCGRT